jgi:hypothetical protein
MRRKIPLLIYCGCHERLINLSHSPRSRGRSEKKLVSMSRLRSLVPASDFNHFGEKLMRHVG